MTIKNYRKQKEQEQRETERMIMAMATKRVAKVFEQYKEVANGKKKICKSETDHFIS